MKPVERWRNWTEGAPPYVPGVLTGTFYAILQYSIPGTVTAGSVVGALIQGAIFGGVMTASIVARRQRDCDAMGFGSDSSRTAVERVLRTGTLSEDTTLDERTQRLVDRRRRQREWGGAVLRTLIVALYVAVLVGFLIAGVLQDDTVLAAFGAIGLALVPLMILHHRRVLRRYDRIEAALTARRGGG